MFVSLIGTNLNHGDVAHLRYEVQVPGYFVYSLSYDKRRYAKQISFQASCGTRLARPKVRYAFSEVKDTVHQR